MGKLKGGNIIGSLGNINFYPYRGEIIARVKPGPKGSPRTAKRKRSQLQKDQLSRFALASRFAHTWKALFNVTFESPENQKGFNQAIGHMMHTAIVGDGAKFRIDFSRLMVARGKALPAEDLKVESTKAGKLSFTWKNNAVDIPTAAGDKALLIVYHEEYDEFWYNLDGPVRTEGKAELDVPFFSGMEIRAWLSFKKKDGAVADSVYGGKVVVK